LTLPSTSLRDLAGLFLRLGATAFGGPAAHVAMLEHEVVTRRRWLDRERFLDLFGAASLIPGPSSTELAIYLGYVRAGWPGLLLGGLCFILPAALIVAAIAWLYVRYGTLPAALGLLVGVKPVLIAIIAQAVWNLGTTALRRPERVVVAVIALVLALLGVNALWILLGAGGLLAFARWLAEGKPKGPAMGNHAIGLGTVSLAAKTGVGLWPILALFLKFGSIVFGSGYVLLAYLRADLVDRLHWLTENQLLDAIAVGQVTPGPVFTTATFIGYVLAGPPGAIAATVGIFLPSFVLVALTGPWIPRIRQSPIAGAFLDGVNAASVAVITSVAWQLGHAAIRDGLTWTIALVGAVLLFRFKLNSAWLVLAGGLVGLVAGSHHLNP